MHLIVGISGASGVVMGYRLIETIKRCGNHKVTLVMTRSAEETWRLETDLPLESIYALADEVCAPDDLAASISSGTYRTDGMVVLPCSMKTLAGIVSGYSDNLLLRAADVCLKEGRKLVLCPREMPLNRIHLHNLNLAAEAGCVILPPMLSFYQGPVSVDDMVDHVVGKILMQFGIVPNGFRVWKEP